MNIPWKVKDVDLKEVVKRVNEQNPYAKVRVVHNSISLNCSKYARENVINHINTVIDEIRVENAVGVTDEI